MRPVRPDRFFRRKLWRRLRQEIRQTFARWLRANLTENNKAA